MYRTVEQVTVQRRDACPIVLVLETRLDRGEKEELKVGFSSLRFRLGVYSVHWILAVCQWHPLASHCSTGRGRDIISNAII